MKRDSLAKRGKSDPPTKPDAQKRGPGRPPIDGPTARQREILDFIRAAIRLDRRPPSIDEIRRHLRFQSTNAVRTHLQSLEKKGLLHIAKNSHRGISIPDEGGGGGDADASRLVPLLGEAAAGSPIEAIEQADEYITLDPALFPQTDIFAIRVRGNSMIDAGIHDRDIALIRPGPEAADGDLVLASLNREVTLKRLRFAGGRPYLHPENTEYSDIIVGDDDELVIIGVLSGIVRKY